MYIYIEREIQTGPGSGFEDMEFPGVLKKYHVEIQGSTEKEVYFPEVFKGCNTILQNFQE